MRARGLGNGRRTRFGHQHFDVGGVLREKRADGFKAHGTAFRVFQLRELCTVTEEK
jgi:predicted ABC-type sugar transport system permease subunit